MPVFNYTAIHKESGVKVKGSMRGSDKKSIIRKLTEKKYIVTSIKPRKIMLFQRNDKNIALSFMEKLYFTKHLAIVIKAGINLSDGLDILLHQAKTTKLHRMLSKITESVNAGQTLSKSLAEFPKSFNPVYVKIVELGEQSGKINKIFAYLVDQLEKEGNLRKKVMSALLYPAIIVGLVGFVGVGLISFVIPKIEGIFKSFDVDLPLPTRMLLYSHEFITNYSLFLVLGIIIFIFAVQWFLKLETIKQITHKLVLQIPVLGNLVRNYNLALFARMLSTLIKSGVPIAQSLKIISNLMNNRHYREKVHEAHNRVLRGASIYEYMQGEEFYFPPFISQMINIGEKTGTMEDTITYVADTYEDEMNSDLKKFSSLLEPLLLLLAGLAVGGIALSIILPIYQLPNLIQ